MGEFLKVELGEGPGYESSVPAILDELERKHSVTVGEGQAPVVILIYPTGKFEDGVAIVSPVAYVGATPLDVAADIKDSFEEKPANRRR